VKKIKEDPMMIHQVDFQKAIDKAKSVEKEPTERTPAKKSAVKRAPELDPPAPSPAQNGKVAKSAIKQRSVSSFFAKK
jgi:hypothetical protein